MIDFHSHILCNVDDGPETIEETKECIKHLSALGFSELIPTPHRFHVFYNPTVKAVEKIMNQIPSSMVKRFSFEYMYSLDSIATAEDLCELYVSPSGWRVILVEFLPLVSRKNDIEQAVFQLNLKGISPLLAHIERYGLPDKFWIQLKNKYSVFYQAGLKTLARTFFESKRKQILRLLDIEILDNMATDLHNIEQVSLVEKGLDFMHRNYADQLSRLFSLSFES